MEGIPAWHKYKNRAAIHLLRWNSSFSANVWTAFCALLDTQANRIAPGDGSYISKAIRLRRAFAAPFLRVTDTFNVTEQQLWALLIERAEQSSTSIDDLSDADAQISRLAASQDALDRQLMHMKLQANATVEAELKANAVVTEAKLKANAAADAEFSRHQSNRAKKPRNVIVTIDQEIDVESLYKKLATNANYSGHTAKELWQVFFGLLDELGASPEEIVLPDGRLKITYLAQGGERSIIDTSFKSKLAVHRHEVSKRNN